MNENIADKNKPVKKRALTSQEQSTVDRFKQKRTPQPATIFRTTDSGASNSLTLAIEEDLTPQDRAELMNGSIMEATGTAYSTVGLQLLTNLGKAIIPKNADQAETVNYLNTVALSMQALGPQDEYEGQLVAQLVVLHDHAMDWLGRAMRTERVDFANVYLNGASKLLTRHHETLEALLKYRRKGEQRVHVEHVHVYGGGQAIVGNVATGEGMKPIVAEGPHAKV